eukprot:Colp12_sorted_trinity150504_noHs@3556
MDGPIVLVVSYNKTNHEVTISVTDTVDYLKTRIAGLTGVPKDMQKLVIKGYKNQSDNTTLKELAVSSGTKVLVIGSKPEEIEQVRYSEATLWNAYLSSASIYITS